MAILKRLHTIFRVCVSLVLSLLALVLAHELAAATTRPVELVVDDEPPVPLPRDCTGVNPPHLPACCAYGYAYYDDVPVAGASVRVESPYGTLTLTTADGGLSDDPYYSVDLSSSPISATVGTLITITATYSDVSVSRTWTVISEGQQVDAGLYSHSATEAIVFTCGSGADPATDDTELYMVEPDGSNLTRLTHNGYVDWNPRISPDGTRIAFCLNETGSRCVLSTMDVDGGNVVTITDQAGGGPYAWVPDGTGITFGLGQVYTIELATGDIYTLTSIAEEYRHPDWSPDGTRLAVDWVQNDSGLGLVVLDLISGTQTMIRSGRTRIPDWHPDGGRIAYELLTGQLRTINPDGTGDTPISTASVAFSPRWSPDGTQIAYATLWNGQVRIINADRTGDHAVPNVSDLSCGWVEGLDWGIARRGLTPPAAAFTATPRTGTVPLDVTFTDQSTGDVNFWTWDFGDGHVSGGRHPANEYEIAGTHTVTLTVAGPGGSDVETKPDYVTVSPTISSTWAFLLYLDGDNNLHSRLQSAFDRLDAASANPHVKILVLIDGSGDGDTWRYEVLPGQDHDWYMGELDMGDPQTLSDFIIWARQTYTTEHTYLAVTDHGRGTSGIAWDDTTGDDAFITVAELRTALRDATVNGTEPLDVVHYDACLMAMIENGYQIKGYADYFVASQNLGWSVFAYDRYVAQVAADTTPEALAAAVVSEYYDATTGHPRTISALDLGQAGAAEDAVNALATALQANLDAYKYYVSSTRSATQKFDSQDYYVINNDDEYLDLYDLARLLKQNVPDQGVKDTAQAVMDAVVAFVIAEQHESGTYQSYPYWDLDDAHGISIYFPPAPGGWDYDDYMSHVFRFTVDSEWDEFLEAYFGLMGLPPTPPTDPGRPPVLDRRCSVYLPVVIR
jgi:PKD repeat protein